MTDSSDQAATELSEEHPFNSRGGPESMRATLNQRAGEVRVVDLARGDLAAAMREVIDAMMRSTADDPHMESAAALVSQAAALLRSSADDRSYAGIAEGSLADGRQNFIDFSPFIGDLNPLAPPIKVTFSDSAEAVGTCTYGAAYEGPPGCLHGGFIAAGFDEILGFAQAFSGQPGMTANLSISYRSPTPLGREVRYVGRLDHVDGRKIHASATLSCGDTLCAQAEGLFISMKPEVFERLLRLRVGSEDPQAQSRPATPPG